ncbi:hypothetical protein [Bradyrhizobium sp. Tv2a-2]|uniref:hypothetical protein n=1 Tax=Bradyrhizobium sp. Tv2a-2 TaxID=113395 RepID=UPI0004651232|nr:hypothetical protein [Bradyrhizobium sp. Tv2a-2]
MKRTADLRGKHRTDARIFSLLIKRQNAPSILSLSSSSLGKALQDLGQYDAAGKFQTFSERSVSFLKQSPTNPDKTSVSYRTARQRMYQSALAAKPPAEAHRFAHPARLIAAGDRTYRFFARA